MQFKIDENLPDALVALLWVVEEGRVSNSEKATAPPPLPAPRERG
jgi:hypothetical protein